MERYESPTIEPVGGVEQDSKSIMSIFLVMPAVFNITVAIVQAIVAAFVIVYTVEVKSINNP